MSHRDLPRGSAFAGGAQDLIRCARRLLSGIDFTPVTLRRTCRCSPRGLLLLALLWAWSDEPGLIARWQAVAPVVRTLWPREMRTLISYQAFLKLLVRWTEALLACIRPTLRAAMECGHGGEWLVGGWAVFGVDGSKLALPWSRSHEARFAPRAARQRRSTRRSRHKSRQSRADRAKKAASPQMWLTMLWHAGTGLPWNWRLGPADSSERDHLLDMLSSLPESALLTADAGFVGYHLWSLVRLTGRELVVRVGSNVRLLKKLGVVRESAGTVYLWPDDAARRGEPPLVLRLIVVQGRRHPWYLVTTVLDRRALSDRQVVEVYRRRWGVEVFYRHFKQTFGRRKLRSHAAAHAECEAHWSLVGLWALLLDAKRERQRQRLSPDRVSVSGALQAYRSTLRIAGAMVVRADRLALVLRRAEIDAYPRRDKRSRIRRRKKYDPPCGPPQLKAATPRQREAAREVTELERERLTA